MSINVDVTPPPNVDIIVSPSGQGATGAQGPPGPPGPSGMTVVAVPYSQWPPASPQPNVLYLRLAP